MSREAVPISQLTENQKNRALAFRRSKFDRRNISALVVRTARDLGATDLRTLDENTSIGIAALAKMFVCDLVESARSISNKNSDALSAISPEDYLEAYACISKECKIKGFDSESSSKAVSDKAWSKEFEDYI